MSPEVTFEDFREEWLKEITEGDPSATEKGRRFARKMLIQWREDINEASDDLVYCDGTGDGGIDIAYLDRGEGTDSDGDNLPDGHTWYLVQSKYGRAFQGNTTLRQEGQKVIDTLDGRQHKLSSLAAGLLERLSNFRSQASERDRMVMVFATEKPLTEDQRRVLDDVRILGRERLGPIFDVESISIESVYLRTLEDMAAAELARLEIALQADLVPSGEDLLVGAISLLDLYDFLKAYRSETENLDQLYEKNVRLFLVGRGKVNRNMRATLQEQPERFGLYNNGITIVVEDFGTDGNGTVKLTDLYVVNGCQTTRTIWEVCQQRLEAEGTGTDTQMQAWRDKASQGVVVTKIVEVGSGGEDLLQKITRYTNSQNAVREKDFLALTSDFRTWAQQMAQHYGVFLEIQRGGRDSRRALQRQNPTLEPQFSEAANAFDLLKVYGAGWLGEAGMAFGKNQPFLPNGRIFKAIVNNEVDDEPFGVDDLYATYRLQQAANEYQFGRGAPKQSRRQTRFLFYMVMTELLKDILRWSGNPVPSPKDFTRALAKLFEPSRETEMRVLLDTAIQVIDEYMMQGGEHSVQSEPALMNTFGGDLNAYLKWEQLGKTEDSSPRFRALLTVHKSVLGRGVGRQQPPRDMIIEAIKA